MQKSTGVLIGVVMWVGEQAEYDLRLYRGDYGRLWLGIAEELGDIEHICLDENKELHDLWDWDLMGFDHRVVDEFMKAAVEAYALDGVV